MRFTLRVTAAGLMVLAAAVPALAFGRGAAVRGARVGPAGGFHAGGAARGVHVGPAGGVRAGNVHHSTHVGPGGTTVQHVGGRGVSAGPLGGVHAGGGGATRVTGPGGRSYTTGHRAGASIGPAGGVSAHASSGAVARGYGGTAAVGRRGGVAVGPYGGVAAGGARAGAAVGPYGGYRAGGVRVGAVGHATGYISPTYMRNSAVAIRTARPYPYFTPGWYGAHAAAWVAPRWVAPVWAVPAWATVSSFVGVTAPPANYDYGSTVVINDNSVYVNGEPAGTAADYAAQAAAIADTGRAAQPAESDEWQPLGVFGMIQEGEQVAQRIFQLGVNKAGLIRGNYYDSVADNTLPVYGSVDKATQRVAWSIGDKKDIVFESGLNNLTQEESTVLVHYGKDRTQQMMLVRLEEPKDAK
jgi:hypothetical protein